MSPIIDTTLDGVVIPSVPYEFWMNVKRIISGLISI